MNAEDKEREEVAEAAAAAAPFDILIALPRGISVRELDVDFGPQFDRKPHYDQDLERSIAETWQARLEKAPSLFNGTKFRYAGFRVKENESGREPPSEEASADISGSFSVTLQLGLTDYRTFTGTNLNSNWQQFLNTSDESQSDSARCQHLADPLGNAAVIETADGRLVVLQRGQNVGEFPDCPVFPGGHPEPSEIGIDGYNSLPALSRPDLNRRIAEEVFEGMLREVEEEVGIPKDKLTNLLFIGMSRRALNARPAAFFTCQTSLTSEEVHECYKVATHGFESLRMRTIEVGSLHEEMKSMPGCHMGGAALYLMSRQARQGQGRNDL